MVSDINTLLKPVNTKKATGIDNIPPKLVTLSAKIIESHLCNIINKEMQNSSLHQSGLFKRKSVEILNKSMGQFKFSTLFHKIYERNIHDSLIPYINKYLSEFVADYRTSYSTSHVLIRLLKNWKEELDNEIYFGAILMDLSKAFDCIPYELLIARMDAIGFSENALTFFFFVPETTEKSVQITNTCSIFQLLSSGVPQSSMLDLILVNLFLNDLFMYIKTLTSTILLMTQFIVFPVR